MVSLVTAGRNDGHAGRFLDRLRKTVTANLSVLSRHVEAEFIVVDWGGLPNAPLGKAAGITDPRVHTVVVTEKDVADRFGRYDFLQFYAKNVGIRHCGGDWVVVLNSDDIITEDLAVKMRDAILSGKGDRFYRARWWVNSDGKRIDCVKGTASEKGLAAVYAGDFLMARKDVLVELGRGYDESNPLHSTGLPQSQMDGEILFNMKRNGAECVVFDAAINHLDHGRRPYLDKAYNKTGYANTDFWGFADFKKERIDGGFVLVPSEKKERIPRNLFMAWAGSEPPVWCRKAFDEYKAVLGPRWNCELFRDMTIPAGHEMREWQDRLPFFTYKSDLFRMWLIEEFGGVWVDTDTRILRGLDPLLSSEGFATVHRDKLISPLGLFHIDSCIIGGEKKGRMIPEVLSRVYKQIKESKLWQFSFNFNTTLTGRCPVWIKTGVFDEIASPSERRDFVDGKTPMLYPRREDSFVRHFLTNLYGNKE